MQINNLVQLSLNAFILPTIAAQVKEYRNNWQEKNINISITKIKLRFEPCVNLYSTLKILPIPSHDFMNNFPLTIFSCHLLLLCHFNANNVKNG